MRSLTSTLVCLALLGCDRGAPVPDEPARSEFLDTLHHPVSGAVARFSGDPRATRLIPLRPMTADSEILFGDPAATGEPFVIRIRELPGLIVPPHSHPVDEHITVVEGTWYFGIGEDFDPAKLQPLPAGSYAFVPAGTTMFAHSPEPAVVQVHGVGPFDVHWKHEIITLDDAGADAAFRYRSGEVVRTPRGEGRIRWGGASGRLAQYEIEGADGTRFVAQEHEVRRP